MKEHPILFSGPMVRAILAGWKTQTRREVKWPLMSASDGSKRRVLIESDALLLQEILKGPFQNPLTRFCPYGAPGHRLWVRETWGIHAGPGITCTKSYGPCVPRKEGGFTPAVFRAGTENNAWGMYGPPKWRPSIHMPRTASRITLEIVSVRVERLQDISESDAIAEGVQVSSVWPNSYRDYSDDDAWCGNARTSYQTLWESINGTGTWDMNPWVWVVEFKRVESEVAA